MGRARWRAARRASAAARHTLWAACAARHCGAAPRCTRSRPAPRCRRRWRTSRPWTVCGQGKDAACVHGTQRQAAWVTGALPAASAGSYHAPQPHRPPSSPPLGINGVQLRLQWQHLCQSVVGVCLHAAQLRLQGRQAPGGGGAGRQGGSGSGRAAQVCARLNQGSRRDPGRGEAMPQGRVRQGRQGARSLVHVVQLLWHLHYRVLHALQHVCMARLAEARHGTMGRRAALGRAGSECHPPAPPSLRLEAGSSHGLPCNDTCTAAAHRSTR